MQNIKWIREIAKPRPSGTGACSKEVFELIHKKMIETFGIFDN
jgi:hypothetical protein